MKKCKIILILLICLFVCNGCNQKNEYTMDEILTGFGYEENNEGIYERNIQNNKYYFYFDDNKFESNYFQIKLKSLDYDIYYYYNKDEIKINDCIFDQTASDKCQEESKYIGLAKSTLNQFLSDFRVDAEQLKILKSEIKLKKIIIKN